MATQVQFRGGSTSEHSTFTGAAREITVDTTLNTVVVHDGSTAGGHPLANKNNPSFTGNVGIGTSSAQRLLHVSGTSTNILRLENTNADVAGIELKGSAGTSQIFHNSGAFRFLPSGTERMRLTAAGSVGIGTSSPSAKLDVVGDIYASQGLYVGNTAGAAITPIHTNQPSSVRRHIKLQVTDATAPGQQYAQINVTKDGVGTQNLEINTVATSNIGEFYVGGDCGIGTTTPSARLHVEKNGSGIISTFRTNSDTNGGIVSFVNGNVATGYVGDSSALGTGDTVNTNFAVRAAGSNNLTFVTGSTATERMRILSNGNVGIGVTAQSSKLEVNGSIGIGREAGGYTFREVPGGTERAGIKSTSGNELVFNTANQSEAMRLTAAGNVGIGTSSPANILHVKGPSSSLNAGATILVDDTAATAQDIGGSIGFRGTVGTSPRTFGRVVGAKENANSAAFDGYLKFETRTNGASTTTERMRITSGGKVGIGATSPASDATLTLGDDSAPALFFRRSGTLQDGAIQFKDGEMIFKGGANSATIAGLGEFMRIDAAGRLGIGTSNPSATLHVDGTVNSSKHLVELTTETGYSFKATQSGVTKFVVTPGGSAQFAGDVETTTAGDGVILKSPNGTRYRLTVANDGTLSTTAV